MPRTEGDASTLILSANKRRSGGHWDADDYDVSDGDQVIGRIMLCQQGPDGRPWFWTIIARGQKSFADRGYAASREEAMADFKVQWFRELLTCDRINDLSTPSVPSFIARCVHCNSQIWVAVTSQREVRRVCFKCAADFAIAN